MVARDANTGTNTVKVGREKSMSMVVISARRECVLCGIRFIIKTAIRAEQVGITSSLTTGGIRSKVKVTMQLVVIHR